jgi:hypothetical protein
MKYLKIGSLVGLIALSGCKDICEKRSDISNNYTESYSLNKKFIRPYEITERHKKINMEGRLIYKKDDNSPECDH